MCSKWVVGKEGQASDNSDGGAESRILPGEKTQAELILFDVYLLFENLWPHGMDPRGGPQDQENHRHLFIVKKDKNKMQV